MKKMADLLYEARMLKELPRSGFHFLGSGRESVAEHTFLTTFAGYVLGRMCPDSDGAKIVLMCLMHDLGEARTGDLNYVQKKYVTSREKEAVSDMVSGVSFGKDIEALYDEYEVGETQEAKLAHDADQLSLIVELKVLMDQGRKGPETWLPHVVKRIKTDAGRQLAQEILDTDSDGWWFEEKNNRP
jgi:putative hydrolase of HD superfamily